jgi:hypothetical protein
MLFHQDMPDFACYAGYAMINAAVDDQTATDATPQPNIEDDPFSNTYAPCHLGKCCCIRIVINYTRYIKTFGEIVLQGKIVPAACMTERAHNAASGINKAPNRNAHTQDTSMREPLRTCHLGEHLIEERQHGLSIGYILQGTTDAMQNVTIQVCQCYRLA